MKSEYCDFCGRPVVHGKAHVCTVNRLKKRITYLKRCLEKKCTSSVDADRSSTTDSDGEQRLMAH